MSYYAMCLYVVRWANQGLEFLLVACEPRILATLTDHEFAVSCQLYFLFLKLIIAFE